MKYARLDIIMAVLGVFLAVYGLLFWFKVLAQLVGLLVVLATFGIIIQGVIDMLKQAPKIAAVLAGAILLGSYLIYS